jgi:tetratricopeptide (TPR) repeat protein
VLAGYLDDPVPEVARAAAVALTGRDPESTWWGIEGLSSRTFRYKTGPEFSRRVIRTLRAKIVEKALIEESPELGGIIYYNGQFSRLSRFGSEISQALIEIVRQAEDYPFEGVESSVRQQQLLTLARQAVLDQVDSAYLKEYQELARNGNQDVKRMAQVALYRLGQPSVLQRQIQMLELSVQRGRGGGASGNLGQLCNIYYAVERYEDAVRCYRSSIALGDESSVDHYNLACSLSRLNRIEEALTALETAFAKGYSSRKSLMRDGDLAVLRGEARFQALLGK